MITMDFFKPEVNKIQYNHILSESGEKEPSYELFFRSKSSIAEKLEVWQSYISGIRRT
jgi:prophage antirepressor-like protein